jgi:iron complex outermembrane receptor protein
MLHFQKIISAIIFSGMIQAGFAQTVCDDVFAGQVTDNQGQLLLGASVWIEPISRGAVTDEQGNFQIKGLCSGEYKMVVKYIGYEDHTASITLPLHDKLSIRLQSKVRVLHDVVILGEHIQQHGLAQSVSVMSESSLALNRGKALGDLITHVPGVSTIMTGPAIFKPVIQGLHGQRILILNNGVKQEGQQWGIEHAPEIDTYIASEIEVVKGAESVRYGADAMGGVILINPASLRKSNRFGGEVNTAFMSNSGMVATSAMVEGKFKRAASWDWRIQGTLKRGGDFRAPSYVLSNTGVSEYNLSGALGYYGATRTFEFFMSSFNSELGILRSAHTGNLEDLQQSIINKTPWYTDDFTYTIKNPKQEIHHHMVKAKVSLPFLNSRINLQYSGQLNKRNEYDIRRGGRSDIPSVSMRLFSNSADATVDFEHGIASTSVGLTTSIKNNMNEPGLGVKPLMPDYVQVNAGAFAIEKIRVKKWLLEAGLRMDYQFQEVRTFNESNQLIKPTFDYTFATGSLGAAYYFTPFSRLISNIGLSSRPPHISELYSQGLHHGTAAIEEGLMLRDNTWLTSSAAVNKEFSKKWILTYQYLQDKFNVEASVFVNDIDDYIYLRPYDTRLTIRGYFPVFRYDQTNARLAGADLAMHWNISSRIGYDHKVSYVYASDRTSNDRFLFIPPPHVAHSLRYAPVDEKWKDFYVEIGLQTYFKQQRAPRTLYPQEVIGVQVESTFDFMPAPKTYSLVRAQVGKNFAIGKEVFTASLSVDNLLNTSYRNYMNRLRYYADDLGRNFSIRLFYTFTQGDKQT